MKKYLVCANTSCINSEDGEITFTLLADNIDSAIEAADRILNTVESSLDFVKRLDVKNVSEITE